MRKLATTLALPAMLAIVGSAFAALPVGGPYTGTTSLHPMSGFKDLVTFVSAKGGRTLRQFEFGTLGCFGNGSFPVGVDPYALAYNEATVASVPVSASGTVVLKTRPSFAETDGIVTSLTISARFADATSLSGTIAVSQNQNGSTCGPVTMKFGAVPGTLTSLGLAVP